MIGRRGFLGTILAAFTAPKVPELKAGDTFTLSARMAVNPPFRKVVDGFLAPCPLVSRFDVLYGMKCQPDLIVRIIGPNDPRYRLKRSDWAHLDPARLPE